MPEKTVQVKIELPKSVHDWVWEKVSNTQEYRYPANFVLDLILNAYEEGKEDNGENSEAMELAKRRNAIGKEARKVGETKFALAGTLKEMELVLSGIANNPFLNKEKRIDRMIDTVISFAKTTLEQVLKDDPDYTKNMLAKKEMKELKRLLKRNKLKLNDISWMVETPKRREKIYSVASKIVNLEYEISRRKNETSH